MANSAVNGKSNLRVRGRMVDRVIENDKIRAQLADGKHNAINPKVDANVG